MSKHLIIGIVFLFLLLSAPFLQAQPVPGGGPGGGVGDPPGGGVGDAPGGGPGAGPGEEADDDDQPPTAVNVALANPSFELGTDAPDNWTPLTGYIGDQYVWDTAVVSAGTRSISTHSTRWEYGRWSSDALAVEGDGFQWYTLTGKVKTLGNNGEVYISIAWEDKDGAFISTADSPMLPEGDNDWSTLTVSALPPDGAVKLSAWCISNHNAGQTWFDDLELTRTHFPTTGAVSYGQFLINQPKHPLAIEANLMQVQELMTKAKWTKEEDFYNTDGQLRASRLYGEAAAIPRNDAVYTNVFTALHDDATERATALAAAQARFDGLINDALWSAVVTSEAGGDSEKSKEYLSLLEGRGVDIGAVGTTGEIPENDDANPPIPE